VLRACDIRKPNAVQRELLHQLVFLQTRRRDAEHGLVDEKDHRALISQWGKVLDRLKATRRR